MSRKPEKPEASAPRRRVLAIFDAGASDGMTIVAFIPRSRALSATPCA